MKNLTTVHSLFALTALTAVMSGCSGTPAVVRPGDQVKMSFTCRLSDGKLAVTTLPDSAVTEEVKSTLYQKRFGEETELVQAARPTVISGLKGIKVFELSAMENLAPHAIGAAVGERRSVVVEVPRYTGLPKNEQYISLPRIHHYPKVVRMTPDEYTARTGQKAEVGQQYITDPDFAGSVSEVSDKEIVVRFTAQLGATVVTAFGKGIIRETEIEYFYTIDAVKGALVRSGDMVGRIVDVSENTIGLDYGHPFGGETLNCEMIVKSIEKPATVEPPVQQAGPAAAATTEITDEIRKEIVAKMFLDAMKKGSKDGVVIENFDKELAERESEYIAATNANKTAVASSAQPYSPVEKGDLVTVDYQAMLEDGSLFMATRKEITEDPARRKVSWYAAPKNYGPETVIAGKLALLPAIGDAVIGMKAGETKRLTLTPEQAFGRPDLRKIEKLPLVITLPRIVTLSADEYVKRAGAFPVLGQELSLTPFFPARVTDVRDKEVDLEFKVEDGATFQDPFGTTVVKKSDRQVITTLTPVIGSSFPLQEGSGIITASDGTTFTVDQNHPLAGKTVVIELTLNSVTRASDLPAGELPWQDEHDAGLAAARKAGKPVVMVLHAEWCGFCKKLFSETMPDPRITALRDRFTWIKVDSDKLTDIKKRYGQQGFPMIVLFRADGSLAQKIDGYQEAAVLRTALQEVL